MVVESRLVNQLSEVRQFLPKLSAGVAGSELAERAFAEAGLRVVRVDASKGSWLSSKKVSPVNTAGTLQANSWTDVPGKLRNATSKPASQPATAPASGPAAQN